MSLAHLTNRFGLPPAAPGQLDRLLTLVAGDPHAPTTVRDPAVAVDAHIADALVALETGALGDTATIADLGSGAGFPGLVLAAALPAARVALVESSGRKCAFLARAISAMGLENAEVVCARAESWVAGIGWADVVTVRALARLNVLVEYAAPLLVDRGRLVAWKGRRDAEEEADGAAAAAIIGLEPVAILPVRPWDGAEHLHLHVFEKVRPTPKRFPRRPGIAAKRPLHASS